MTNAAYMAMIRKISEESQGSYSFELPNLDVLERCKIESITMYNNRQQQKYVAHTISKLHTA